MAVSVKIDVSGLRSAIERINGLEKAPRDELLDALAQLGAHQTRRRIAHEKRSPGGKAWPKNLAGTSILFRTGQHLYDSIDHKSNQSQAEWGSGAKGARVHQFGAVIRPVNAKKLAFTIGGKSVFADQVNIPARPYLGVSRENEVEFEKTALRFIHKYAGQG